MMVDIIDGRPREEARNLTTEWTDEALDLPNVNAKPDLKKKARTKKKPKDKPKRPLSAYNMFFQNQRERIIAGKMGDPTAEEIKQSVSILLNSKSRGPKRRQDRISHGQISFGDLARKIAAKWKAIDPKAKAIYDLYAGQEKSRYQKELVIWKDKKESEYELSRHDSLCNSSTSLNDSVTSIMTSSTSSLSASLTSSFNPSDSFSSLQNSSFHDGGSSSSHRPTTTQDDLIQRQQDILRQQMGFVDNEPHARDGVGGNDTVARQGSDNLKTTGLIENDEKCSGTASLIRQEHQQKPLLQQQANLSESQHRLMAVEQSDQYKQLEDITKKLEDLKQQQRRMQLQMKDLHLSNGSLQPEDLIFDGSSHHTTHSTGTTMRTNNYASGYSTNNNNSNDDFSVADFESRQRMDGFFSSDRGHSSCPSTFHATDRGVIGCRRRSSNSSFRPGDNIINNIFGNSSLTSSSLHSEGQQSECI